MKPRALESGWESLACSIQYLQPLPMASCTVGWRLCLSIPAFPNFSLSVLVIYRYVINHSKTKLYIMSHGPGSGIGEQAGQGSSGSLLRLQSDVSRAAVICSLDWGWRIHLRGGSLTWLVGWFWQVGSLPQRAIWMSSLYGDWLPPELMNQDYSVLKQKL